MYGQKVANEFLLKEWLIKSVGNEIIGWEVLREGLLAASLAENNKSLERMAIIPLRATAVATHWHWHCKSNSRNCNIILLCNDSSVCSHKIIRMNKRSNLLNQHCSTLFNLRLVYCIKKSITDF